MNLLKVVDFADVGVNSGGKLLLFCLLFAVGMCVSVGESMSFERWLFERWWSVLCIVYPFRAHLGSDGEYRGKPWARSHF
jgi:hypothetical protein